MSSSTFDPAPSTTIPVLDGILLVHTDDHTISYEGRRCSEQEMRRLHRCLTRLLTDVEEGTLTPRESNWGDWLLEVNEAGEIFISGLLTDVDQLYRYATGCAESLAILDGEPSDPTEDSLTPAS